jgi:hypothetical protein
MARAMVDLIFSTLPCRTLLSASLVRNQYNALPRRILAPSSWGEKRIDRYHEPLGKKLMAKGFNVLGEFTCFGFTKEGILKLTGGANKGRPNEEDLKKAEDFARTLQKKMTTQY